MSVENNSLVNANGAPYETQSDEGYETLEIGDSAVLDSFDNFNDFLQAQTVNFRNRNLAYRRLKPFKVPTVKGRDIWIDEFKKPRGVYSGTTGRILCTRIDAHKVVPNLGIDTPAFGLNIVVEGLNGSTHNPAISFLSSLDMTLSPVSEGRRADVSELKMRFLNKKLEGDLKSFEQEHNRAIDNALKLARLAISHPLQGGRADGNT